MEILGYGVSRLSVVSVRKDPHDRAEQVTQLLFGDEYEVIEKSGNEQWLKIRIVFDGSTGWIDNRQYFPVSKEYFEYVGRADFKITTDLTSTLLYNKNKVTLPIGSIIPISNAELFRMEEQFAFNGESKSVGTKREFDFLRAILQKYLYTPYQWGGKTPFGIDSSGFTQIAFKICGYRLLRDVAQQAQQGRSVPSFDDTLPGDLAFFKAEDGSIVHVGVVVDTNKVIHVSGFVRVDSFDQQGIFDGARHTYSLSHIRRILPS